MHGRGQNRGRGRGRGRGDRRRKGDNSDMGGTGPKQRKMEDNNNQVLILKGQKWRKKV